MTGNFHPTRITWLRKLLLFCISLIRPSIIKTKFDFRLFIPKSDKSIYVAKLFLTGTYEFTETKKTLESIHKGSTVVDIGANIGYYTCLMGRQMDSTGKVYAIEPDAENRNVLNKNIKLNHLTNVDVRTYALGERHTRLPLYRNPENLGAHSLVHNDQMTETEIEVQRFDDVIPKSKIDFIKIDVEGYELSVLQGMTGFFKDDLINMILCEFTPFKIKENEQNPESFLDLIESYNFKIEVLSNTIDREFITAQQLREELTGFSENKYASFNLLISK